MKDTKAKDNTVTCSYMDMVVSTLWWHLFMLVPLPIWMKGYTMRWPRNGTRWIRNSRHDVTQDSNFTWWPLPATWYSGWLDARSGWFDAGFGSYYYAHDQNHKNHMEFYKRFNGNKIYTWKYFDYTRIQLMNKRTLRLTDTYIGQAC